MNEQRIIIFMLNGNIIKDVGEMRHIWTFRHWDLQLLNEKLLTKIEGKDVISMCLSESGGGFFSKTYYTIILICKDR